MTLTKAEINELHKQRLHTRVLQNCGIWAECIKYDKHNDITVKFDTGEIRKSDWGSFYNYHNVLPISRTHQKEKRLHTRILQKCGIWAECTEYNSSDDVTIRFDTGETRRCNWRDFYVQRCVQPAKSRKVVNRKQRLHTRILQDCGIWAECISYEDAQHVTVRFDTGFTKICEWHRFCKGLIRPTERHIKNRKILKEQRLHTRVLQNCGIWAECIEYNGCDNVTIKFDTGETRCCHWTSFCKKHNVTPSGLSKKDQRLHEKVLQKCGIWAECIGYKNEKNAIIEFETGYITKCKNYQHFEEGKLKPYGIFEGYKLEGMPVFIENGEYYYIVRDLETNEKDIMTCKQIQERRNANGKEIPANETI